MIDSNNNIDRNRKLFQDKMLKTLKEYNKVILDSTVGKNLHQSKNNLIKKFDELKQKLSKAEQFYLRNRDSDEDQDQDNTVPLNKGNPIFNTHQQKNLRKALANEMSQEKPIYYTNLISK